MIMVTIETGFSKQESYINPDHVRLIEPRAGAKGREGCHVYLTNDLDDSIRCVQDATHVADMCDEWHNRHQQGRAVNQHEGY